MMNKKLYEIICEKDENKAKTAAYELVTTANTKEFELLCEKMDYLFEFVKDNVCKRLSNAVNKNNYKNIIKFFDFYSPYFDDLFASILAKYADEDLTDEIFDILLNGNDIQKTYAAAYFKKIPDTVAIDDLRENLETDFDPLFENCAAALSGMNDKISYEKYIEKLQSDDDFEKIKAVKFLIAYGDKNAVNILISAMESSSMSENIAGEITALISPSDLLSTDYQKGILLSNNLINGLGEILPLENIFGYEIYEITDFMFNNANTPEAALILFNLKNKFDTFTQNEEYVFDLDKNTKNEVFEINKILSSKPNEFWNREKLLLGSFLTEDNPFLHTVLEIIRENKFSDFTSQILDLTKSQNETFVYESAVTLKYLGELKNLDKTKVTFNNQNLKASFEQLFLV